MNQSIIKTTIALIIIIILIVMALKTQRTVVNSKLFASLGIIVGAFAMKNLSPQKPSKQ